MKSPAVFSPESGGFVVTFRDIPEAITQGDDEADAMFMAHDVQREAMSVYFYAKRAVPRRLSNARENNSAQRRLQVIRWGVWQNAPT